MKSSVSVWGNEQTVSVIIQTTKDQLVPTLKLITEILRQPTFPADEFEKMRNEQLADIDAQRSDPQSLASMEHERLINPYPKTDFRYTPTFDELAKTVTDLKLADVGKFYNEFYNSSNATVAIIGSFDETQVLAELNKVLANWTSPVQFTRAPGTFFDMPPQSKQINTPDKANATMMAGVNLPLQDNDTDYPALVIGNYMLGGGFLNSRLAVRIRQKDGLSYGVGSYIQASSFDKVGMFGSFAIYNPINSAKLVVAYKEELNKMLKDGFSEAELKDAVSGYLQQRKVSRSQDRELVGRLSNNLYLNRTMQWDADLESKIAALKPSQINAAMKRWIDPEKITIVEAGDFQKTAGVKSTD
jgi:zinc protease